MEIADGTLLDRKVSLVTVKNYLRAASEFATSKNLPDPRFRYDVNGNRIGGPNEYFPALQELYTLLEKWKNAKAEGLPLTMHMLRALVIKANKCSSNSELACIRDSTCLGLYTGSRCSEYCKGRPTKSQPFSVVPSNPQTTDNYAGWPIAFTSEDFQFISHDLKIVPWYKVDPKKCSVRIRFRYDKGGGRNFSERTFSSVNTTDEILQYFCPVRTALRILSRWASINGTKRTPVFCYLNQRSQLTYLADSKVTSCYRDLVKELYPDPSHMFNKRLKDFRTHSIRITACLLLVSSGASSDVIAFKLRWASEAWRTYLREHLDDIQDQTTAVFLKAVSNSSNNVTPNNLNIVEDEEEYDQSIDDGR